MRSEAPVPTVGQVVAVVDAQLGSDLIEKISGWYIEYHLMRKGYISRMTEYGIAEDDSLDRFLRAEDDPSD